MAHRITTLPGDGIGIVRRPQPLEMGPVVALTPIQTLDAAPLLQAIADPTAHLGLSSAIDVAAALAEGFLNQKPISR